MWRGSFRRVVRFLLFPCNRKGELIRFQGSRRRACFHRAPLIYRRSRSGDLSHATSCPSPIRSMRHTTLISAQARRASSAGFSVGRSDEWCEW